MLASSDMYKENLSACETERPYIDPAFNNPKTYGRFLDGLHSRGMIAWKREYRKSLLGIFFVAKKDNRIRLIFDTRICNCYFQAPPHVALPTAAALTGLEARAGETLYFSSGDIRD